MRTLNGVSRVLNKKLRHGIILGKKNVLEKNYKLIYNNQPPKPNSPETNPNRGTVTSIYTKPNNLIKIYQTNKLLKYNNKNRKTKAVWLSTTSTKY